MKKRLYGVVFALPQDDEYDGYSEYAVAFHPESQDHRSARETLEVIFRSKNGLLIDR